jgi:hypothetical protein
VFGAVYFTKTTAADPLYKAVIADTTAFKCETLALEGIATLPAKRDLFLVGCPTHLAR